MSGPETIAPPPEFQDSHAILGRNIRAVRDLIGLSRETVAERAGIPADYLGEIERGEKWPALWRLRAIARALDVPTARFFEFEGEPTDDAGPVAQLRTILNKRSRQEQNQALRVVRALFDH
jgi:transcriptional regulator with XRE-family HTH domain